MPQLDLFPDEDTGSPEYRADPEVVRAHLKGLLAEARAAQRMPWEPGKLRLYRSIFPEMTRWLPDAEAAQFRHEFEAELARFNVSRR